MWSRAGKVLNVALAAFPWLYLSQNMTSFFAFLCEGVMLFLCGKMLVTFVQMIRH